MVYVDDASAVGGSKDGEMWFMCLAMLGTEGVVESRWGLDPGKLLDGCCSVQTELVRRDGTRGSPCAATGGRRRWDVTLWQVRGQR